MNLLGFGTHSTDETKLMPMDYLLSLAHYHNVLFYFLCLWTSVTLHTRLGLEFVPCFQISISPLTSPALYFLLNKCVSVSLTSFICAPGPNLCITWRPFVLCFISHSFDFAASFFVEQMHSLPLHTIYSFHYLLSSECFCKRMASFPLLILADTLDFFVFIHISWQICFWTFSLKDTCISPAGTFDWRSQSWAQTLSLCIQRTLSDPPWSV